MLACGERLWRLCLAGCGGGVLQFVTAARGGARRLRRLVVVA